MVSDEHLLFENDNLRNCTVKCTILRKNAELKIYCKKVCSIDLENLLLNNDGNKNERIVYFSIERISRKEPQVHSPPTNFSFYIPAHSLLTSDVTVNEFSVKR